MEEQIKKIYEKTKQWLEYNLSLIPESIEKLKAAQSA